MKKRHGLYLNPGHRRLFYSICGVLFLTGALWALLQRVDESGNASESLRQWKPRLLSLHGIAAVGFALLLGTLFAGHVPRAWRAEKNRRNGVFFLISVSLLMLSGHLLYYTGDEAWRSVMSRFHWIVGLASPALLAWHVLAGRRLRDPGEQE